MKVTTKKLSDLKHPEKNVRIHSEQQIRELKRSLEKFGQTRALVIDENNIILIGSEMFGRSSRKRKESEQGQEQKDYKQELINLFDHMEIFDTPHKRHVAERYRNFFIAVSAIATPEDCKHIYEGLISGDPKMRTFRALYQRIYGRYINNAKKERKHG